MASTDDTIVAIATPSGPGGLGVIRLSGPQAIPIADRAFLARTPLSTAASHTLHHGWISDGPRRLDEVVAAVFRSPQSYTGDDVIEFSCHGSPAVLKQVVALCLRNGARAAQPGEFTQRAFLNGKMDLAQAEAVAALIHAQSERAARAATDQLRGILSGRITSLRHRLIDLLAHLEANLDFSEEGIPFVSRDVTAATLGAVADDIEALLSTGARARVIRDGVRVAFAGRPNVGKSSLFNALLAYDRAIVSSAPGTTRDTLEERLLWNGHAVVLIDTAGLRDTTDTVEEAGADRARRAQAGADVVVWVVDGSLSLSDEDLALASALKDRPVVAVANKSDLPAEATPENLLALGARRALALSARTGEGLVSLRQAIVDVIDDVFDEPPENTVLNGASAETPIVTQLRHVRHLEAARERVTAARAAFGTGATEEAIALDLRAAVDELGAITGESASEEVLTSLFRQFCIGK